MPRLTPIELCIANLRGDFPSESIGFQSSDDALAELKQRTGKDFGMDVAKWVAWLQENPEVVSVKVKSISDARKLARAIKKRCDPEDE